MTKQKKISHDCWSAIDKVVSTGPLLSMKLTPFPNDDFPFHKQAKNDHVWFPFLDFTWFSRLRITLPYHHVLVMFSTTVPIVKMPWSTQGPRHSLVISAPDEAPSSENLSGLPDELMRPDGVSKLEVTVRKALEEMFRTWRNLFHELFAGSGKCLQIEAEFLQTWFLYLIFQHFSSVLPIYIYIYIHPKDSPIWLPEFYARGLK